MTPDSLRFQTSQANGWPGRFVCLEGPDGAGKTTQAARLVRRLEESGRTVLACRDPGGTPLGDRLRHLLQARDEVEIGLRAEMLLFMASRAQLVETQLIPALEAGHIIVGDRYLLSNVVYQGHAGGLNVESVWNVGWASTGGLMPDLTIVLDLSPELARARVGAPRDRIEDRPEAYRRRVRDGFLDAAASYPTPIVVVDGGGPIDAVTEQLWREVTHALGFDPRA